MIDYLTDNKVKGIEINKDFFSTDQNIDWNAEIEKIERKRYEEIEK